MANKNRKQVAIEVLNERLVTSVEQLWTRSVASWARATRATQWTQMTSRVPHRTTRLIN